MDLKAKKILVTGSGGFLGTHVMAALRGRGISQRNIRAPRSVEMDLTNREDCEKAVKGVDIVIHLAGLTGDGKFHREHPAEIFYANAAMGTQLMDAAYCAGVKKFVAAGSAAEYPADAAMPLKEGSLWDGPPELSHAPYAIAKRALLAEGQAYHDQYGFGVVHLLFASMYGPFAKPGSSVIPTCIEKIAEAKQAGRGEASFYGSGNSTRDFLYGADAAEAVLLATERYEGREPVNVGSGTEITIKKLAAMIAGYMGFRGEVRFDPKANDADRRVLDITRAKQEFGFSPKTALAEGLQKTIEWYNREHAAGPSRP